MNNKKSRKTPGAPAALMISVILLMTFPKETVRRVFNMLIRGGGRFILSHPEQLMVFLVFIVLLVIAILSFLRLVVHAGKKQAAKPKSPSVRSAPQRHQDAQPAVSTLPRIPLHRNNPSEDAIHCEHKTGREKYLDQINGFLKNGLIDRAEFNVLRERYEKLNIPDDYHG